MSWLSLQNHWWREGRVKPDLAKEFKRERFSELERLVSVRQAVIISGLRRVGKSTMMM
jgi:predicted AAA+ superfamily ATPase